MAQRVLLYVEDDDAAFFVIQLTLQEVKADIALYRATDGEEALAFVHKTKPHEDAPRPDLILLDLNLPKRSGMEVLTELKRDESLRSIPVIMFSSSPLRVDERKSLELGAQEYMTKPSSLEGFVETLKRALTVPERSSGSNGIL